MQADHEVLQQSCDDDFLFHGEGASPELRTIEVDIKDKEYLDFLSVCIEEELSVEKKLQNIIRYHVIVYRNKSKLKPKILDQFS